MMYMRPLSLYHNNNYLYHAKKSDDCRIIETHLAIYPCIWSTAPRNVHTHNGLSGTSTLDDNFKIILFLSNGRGFFRRERRQFLLMFIMVENSDIKINISTILKTINFYCNVYETSPCIRIILICQEEY